jgi:inner membrane protein
MPSVFSHAIAAAALGAVMAASPPRRVVWSVGALCAVLPDLDVLTMPLGVPWGHVLSHRGLSHSLPFAAGLALVVAAIVSRWLPADPGRLRLWAFFFAATASHGLLDAMTSGGPGIAFFAPFSDARYFFPWRPIVVSPLGISAFFSRWGLEVMASELVWLWLPAAAVILTCTLARCRRTPEIARAATSRRRP